jgi:ubiquinone biosynthesis protein COQ9
MSENTRSEYDHLSEARAKILDAALIHVVFDGWSDRTLEMAANDSAVPQDLAKLAFPRGGVDMARAFHDAGDAQLAGVLKTDVPAGLGMTAKITWAVRQRLELVAGEKEAVRRGTTLFALPVYAGEGARAIWQTADTIWSGLGDTSTDINWYTKRATLSGVYGSTVLYWLGDESEGHADTWAFLDRRIDDVMGIEKAKAKLRESGAGKMWAKGPGKFFELIKAPGHIDRPMPGRSA